MADGNDKSYGNDHGNGMFGQVGTTATTRFLTPTGGCSPSQVPEGVRNDNHGNNYNNGTGNDHSYDNDHSYGNNCSYDNNHSYNHDHANGYPRLTSRALFVLCSGG